MEETVLELQPKASYCDIVLNCPDLVPTTQIAKDYGWSAQQMNKHLADHGIQYRKGSVWYLYQKYAECEYTGSKTFVHGEGENKYLNTHTYWTQKGRMFIYNLLKKDGILPTVERK